ncbi:DNA primase [Actinobacillus delphinicola]|uniref:DNA primase n=1 Tax=Actinobacillus delphinicola TaxID=51161 RepID=UPI0024410AB8|nr:DNA primase [Actinobacillus delphinicola]MDG6897566.1 DNA primase [Actinobacillus delphinicola]
MAGSIPRGFIDDLLAKTDIVDVVSSRVKLKKAGREYHACCPFHHEKTPSFTVSPKKQFYYCFGCHAKGNAITFLMEYDQLSFVEAIEELASRLGLDVPYERSSNFDPQKPQPAPQAKRDLYDLMQQIALFYRDQLTHSMPALDYVRTRDLSPEVISRYLIGYAPAGYDILTNTFRSRPNYQKDLLDLGMLASNDRGKHYDRFRDRLIFPIRDRRGRVIAFGGRVLNNTDKPKYLNSPETATYHKGRELYGLYEVLQNRNDIQQLLIVEGYMDVVALAQFGVDYAVASLGTATTPEQLRIAYRHTDKIVCCYDADRAGRDAAWRALENVLPLLEDGRQIKFIFLPDGEDPDTFVRKYGKESFEAYIENAQGFSDFFFNHLKPLIDFSSEEGKIKLVSLSMPLIAKIPGEMLKNHLITTLQGLVGVWDRQALMKLYQQQKDEEVTPDKKATTTDRKITPIRVLISLLLQDPSLANLKTAAGDEIILPPVDELQDVGFSLFSQLFQQCKEHIGLTTGQLLENWRESKFFNALEILATWDHLVEDENLYEMTFIENLRVIQKQYLEKRIATLIAKERSSGLEDQERVELAMLIQGNHL